MSVVIAAVVSMIIGALWYSPMLFADAWMKEVGKTKTDLKKGATHGYIVSAIAAFITAFVMASFIQQFDSTWSSGAITGAVLWFGFYFTSSKVDYVFAGRSMKLFWINNSHQLVSFVAIGAIVGSF